MEPGESAGEKTLLEWAQRLCPDTPRKRVKEWIAAGRFYLDGVTVTQAGRRLADPGDALTLGKADPTVAGWTRRRRIHPFLTVVYLDRALAVVDKGPGLLSLPHEGHGSKSALQLLADHLNDSRGDGPRRQIFGSGASVQPLPVHRLDQYTSGLLCIAFNAEARAGLIDQLRRGELVREYTAFADGVPAARAGVWRHFMKLDADGYRQALVAQGGDGAEEAVTRFTVEAVYPRRRVTRLRLRLETGLKHQIRLQAAAEGLPLLGDRSYHPATRQAVEQHKPLPFGMTRQALHACLIGLRHPAEGRELRFSSPLPADLQRLQQRLEED